MSSKRKSGLRLGDYYLKQTIGIGSFGKVKVGYHATLGTKVAIKIINRDKIKDARYDFKIKREITNMNQMRHQHIVQLFEVIETPSDIFMILEYVNGGELFDYIINNGKLSEEEGRTYFQQIISAMSYCHNRKVAHRDLKPENLLIDLKTRSIKIADFGLSSLIDDGELLKTACGSPNYAAPEVISGKYYTGPEADIWSCGIILYALVTARLPFDDNYIPHLFQKIRAGKFSIPSYLSPELKDLIRAILVVNSVDRITIAEIFAHPWFKVDLPEYLTSNLLETVTTSPSIDEQLVDEIVMRGKLPKTEVLRDLENWQESHSGTPPPAAIMYDLLYSSGDYSRVNSAPTSPSSSFTPASSIRSLDHAKLFSSSPPVNLRKQISYFSPETPSKRRSINIITAMSRSQKGPNSPSTSSSSPTPPGSPKSLPDPEKSLWYLGLISRTPPKIIIRELLRSLRKNNFEWKVTGVYQLRCRYHSPYASSPQSRSPATKPGSSRELFPSSSSPSHSPSRSSQRGAVSFRDSKLHVASSPSSSLRRPRPTSNSPQYPTNSQSASSPVQLHLPNSSSPSASSSTPSTFSSALKIGAHVFAMPQRQSRSSRSKDKERSRGRARDKGREKTPRDGAEGTGGGSVTEGEEGGSRKQLYLLDIKLIEGGHFQFFHLCSRILADLKHLETPLD